MRPLAPQRVTVALSSGNYFRTLSLLGVTYTNVGVIPRGFTGETIGQPVDIWFPLAMASQVMLEVPGGPQFTVMMMGRLKPGVSMDRAQAASQAAFRQILVEEAGPSATAAQVQVVAAARLALELARGATPRNVRHSRFPWEFCYP